MALKLLQFSLFVILLPSETQSDLITLHLPADHESTSHGPGKYAAIVMPHYCGSIAVPAQMSEAAIEAGGRRMVHACELVHSKGLVHMDVKVQKQLLQQDCKCEAWHFCHLGCFRAAATSRKN